MAKDDNVIDLFGDEKDVIEELFDTSGALLVLSMSDEGEMSLSSNVEVDTLVMMLEAAKMSLVEDGKVH